MKTVLKRALQVLLVLGIIAVGVGVWNRDLVMRLMAVNSLFDQDRIVQNFSHMDTMFLTLPLPRGDAAVSTLLLGPPAPLSPAAGAWIAERSVTGIVMLKGGALVHESYYLGTTPEDLRISWSMAKSVLSLLMGTVLAEGKIASLDDPVVQYAPQLKGSAYDGATIRQVLNMASGVRFNEDYFDFYSDINKMGRVLALGGSMDAFAAGLTERDAEPGTAWQYVSIDTHVLGMVIRGATGRGIGELVAERIIAPLGLEADPYYVTDGLGEPFVLGGLNLRTRDYARIGQLVLQKGMWGGTQIVPADWIAQSTVPSAPGGVLYGYQWWMPDAPSPGEVLARGVYGQYIYINPTLDVVIAINSADRGFDDPGVYDGTIAMLRQMAAGL
jgi:CubicO group peptidase (beta-lactamase class C family)